jgi:hypothetical protein
MNKEQLRQELREAQDMIYCILSDTSHPVMDSKHPHYHEANNAFFKLELYAAELADRIQSNGRSAPECRLGHPRIKPININ